MALREKTMAISLEDLIVKLTSFYNDLSPNLTVIDVVKPTRIPII